MREELREGNVDKTESKRTLVDSQINGSLSSKNMIFMAPKKEIKEEEKPKTIETPKNPLPLAKEEKIQIEIKQIRNETFRAKIGKLKGGFGLFWNNFKRRNIYISSLFISDIINSKFKKFIMLFNNICLICILNMILSSIKPEPIQVRLKK